MKARLKTAQQHLSRDFSVFFLGDICSFSHLVERIVLTSSFEGLSDSTLRWELKKSKPATTGDAVALAMELNLFLELEKGAPSSTQVALTSVKTISREALEPSIKEWMDELVRTITEAEDCTQSQKASQPRNSRPNCK